MPSCISNPENNVKHDAGLVQAVGGLRDPRSRSAARRSAQAPRPLEYITKSVSAFREVINSKTGEIQVFTRSEKCAEFLPYVDPETSRKNSRSARYELQNEARRLLVEVPRKRKDRLPPVNKLETAQHLAVKAFFQPEQQPWRVTGCGRRRIDDEVKVLFSDRVKRAHFGNLMICGSAWTCPVCSAKIAERRRQEISVACDVHSAAGGGLAMVTLTFRHDRFENLKEMISRLRESLKIFRGSRKYKSLLAGVGYVGLVRALEVTHGFANGWHPHLHELWFFDKPLTDRRRDALQRVIFDLWHKACEKVGLGLPNRQHGVKVTSTISPEEYLSKLGRDQKWGVGSELTQLAKKVGKIGSRSPFDLLRLSSSGDKVAGRLFQEFAFAFFGARQLFWSHGLKAAFGLVDLTDGELAEQEEEDAKEIYVIDADFWKIILAQPFDVRGSILSVAEHGGHDAVHQFLLRL